MLVRRLISEQRLAEIIRIHPDSFWFIRGEGKLESDTRQTHKKRPTIFPHTKNVNYAEEYTKDSTASHYYSTETLQQLFFSEGTTLNAHLGLPNLDTLLSGDDNLLTIKEVADRIGVGYENIRTTFIGGGQLAAFHLLGSIYRVPESAFALLHASLNNNDAIRAKDAALLLGVAVNTVSIWVNDATHPLARVTVAGKNNQLFVSRKSLRELLAQHLPDYVTVDEWWEYRMRHQGPLLTTVALAELCHTRTTTIIARLTRHKVPYIMTPSKKRRIPREAVEHWIKDETTLTPEELTRIFGDPRITDVPRKLLCPDHFGQAARWCLRRSCITRYLRANHFLGSFDEDAWLRTALVDGVSAVSLERIMEEHPLLSWRDVEQLIAEGHVQAAWMPNPQPGGEPMQIVTASSASALLHRAGLLERRYLRLR